MELWFDIPEFEGLYQISTKKSIRSLPRKIVTWRGHERNMKGKDIKPIFKGGSQWVCFSKDGRKYDKKVCQLFKKTRRHYKGILLIGGKKAI